MQVNNLFALANLTIFVKKKKMDDQIKFENKESGKEGVLKSKTKVIKTF